MAKLPTSLNLSGPDSLRSGRVIASHDTSAVGRGLANLGGSLSVIAQERKNQENALDVTRAEAYKDEGFLGIQNEFDNDPEYSTYEKRAPGRTSEVINKAANLIRDPKKRELWLARAESDRARVNDGIFDSGVQKQRAAEIIAFDDALEVNRRIYVDPNTSDEAKAKAKGDISASISMAQEVGLLDPVTAEARRKAFVEDAEFSRGQLAVARDPDALTGGVDASSLIRGFEGFRDKPYWDVNAYRTGYGSDTITKSDGSIVKVEPGMTITRADGERDLARRVKEFEQGAARDVGDAWGLLPKYAQSALTSTAYNYGSLPSKVVAAAKTGDLEAIASAVENLKTDNAGVNKGRRLKEASVIRGDSNPAWFNNLSPEQQAALNHQAETQRQKNQTVANAQLTAEREARKDAYKLRIETHDPTLTPKDILDDPVINDGDKASLYSSLETKNKDASETAAAISAFSQGNLKPDPYDTKGVGLVDKAYDELVKHATPETIQSLGEEMVRQSGVVPQPALNVIRGALAGTDEAAAMAALQSARRISAIDPAALARRSGGSDVQTSVDDFNFYVDRLNMSPDEATKRIMAANDPQKKRDRKALEPLAKDFVKTMETFDIADSFDTFFGSEPELGFSPGQAAGMQAELLAMAEEQFYASNGDPEIAQNRAVEEFKRLYGVTEVTGKKVVTRHPPERYWPNEDKLLLAPLDYARQQLLLDVVAEDPEFNQESIQLVPTRETEAMIKRGEMPGYAVIWTDENGVMQTMPGKLWKPDITAINAKNEAKEQERERAVADGVVKARELDTDIRAGRDREQNLDNFLDFPEGAQ